MDQSWGVITGREITGKGRQAEGDVVHESRSDERDLSFINIITARTTETIS